MGRKSTSPTPEPEVELSPTRREMPTALIYALCAHLFAIILLLNSPIWIRSSGHEIPPKPFALALSSKADLSENAEEETEEPAAQEEEASAQAGDPSSAVAALPEIPVEAINETPPDPQGSGASIPPQHTTEKPTEKPASASSELLESLGAGEASGIGVGSAYDGRSMVGRGIGLRRNGGSQAGEDAVTLGLKWLAGVQDLDDPNSLTHGRWDVYRFARHYLKNDERSESSWAQRYLAEGGKDKKNSLGLSALVLLAFTGHGESATGDGIYAKNVAAGLAYLRRHQDGKGAFINVTDRGGEGDIYDHSLALLALADHAAMTKDQSDLKAIQRGVTFLEDAQHAAGGFDYKAYPGGPSYRRDLSITGFAAMALVAAKSAGAKLNPKSLQLLIAYLDEATTPSGAAIYLLGPASSRDTSYTMTSVNLFLRRLLGQPSDHPIQAKQLDLVTRFLPEYDDANKKDHDPYRWYYSSLAILIGGDHQSQRWQSYNAAMQRTLIDAQERSGVRRGSWPPTTYYAELEGGRIYATAISVLSLECYYRYQPASLRHAAQEFAEYWPK